MKYFKLYEAWLTDLVKTPEDDNTKGVDSTDGGVKQHSTAKVKMSDADKQLLLDLDKRYEEIQKLQLMSWYKHPTNWDEEEKRFFEALDAGKEYQPVWKHKKNKFTESDINEAERLREEFKDFIDCYIAPYYVESLTTMINYMRAQFMDKNSKEYFKQMEKVFPKTPVGLYEKAKSIMKENPYVEVKTPSLPHDSTKMKQILTKALSDRGMTEWKVEVVDYIAPRMSISSDYIVRLNKDAKFSDDDIEGLIAHEIEGHVARRWHGHETGLSLFRYGLPGKLATDEGLAIWKSLDKPNPKPNILFNISLTTVLSFYLDKMNFTELFNLCIDKYDMDKETAFYRIARSKRYCKDTSVLFGDYYDHEYLSGYLDIKKMDDNQRKDILEYNIGFQQMPDLINIKKFLKENKFVK